MNNAIIADTGSATELLDIVNFLSLMSSASGSLLLA